MKIDNIEVKLSTYENCRIIFFHKDQSLFYIQAVNTSLYEVINLEGIDTTHELDLTSSYQLKIIGIDEL